MAFWNDVKVAEDFTPSDRFFFLYLLTNPHTNLCGCYELGLKKASDETGYSKAIVEKLIQKLESEFNVIRYDIKTKEVLIINWHKYNWTTSEKFKKPLLVEIQNVKTERFKEYLMQLYSYDKNSGYGIDTTCIDTTCTETNCINTECMDTSVTVTVNNTVTDTVIDKEIKHKYGEYENVLLSDKEMDKLKNEFPSDWNARIESLSVYMKSKGVVYKDHLATIRHWARMDKERKTGLKKKTGFVNYEQRETDYDKLILEGNFR